MKYFSGSLLLLLLWSISLSAQYQLRDYNIIWNTPSTDEAGNMPIGNGSMGSNVWTDNNGDLLLYLSRNDAHSELQRLLKPGRVRISFAPRVFAPGTPFRQELDLATGTILLTGAGVSLQIFIHTGSPVLYISGNSRRPLQVRVTLENWRRSKHDLNKEELAATWVYREGVPPGVDAWESADTILPAKNNIRWFHRNAYSCVPVHIREQGLQAHSDAIKDPLLHNTFGGYIRGNELVSVNDTVLESRQPLRKIDIRMVCYGAQTPTRSGWEQAITRIAQQSPAPATAWRDNQQWWKDYWGRSWMYVQENDKKDSLSDCTRAYILSRYQLACQMRNDFPVRFQGGMFNVDPRYACYGPDVRQKNYSADYRFYGVSYWWQNVRFIYQPQYAQGNFDLMQPFFRFYLDRIPAMEAAASAHYKASGIYMTETLSTFGLPGMGDYGFGRQEYSEEYTQNIWQQCLEMSVMMLDYYHYTGDTAFLRKNTLTWANKALSFYRTRFRSDSSGKLYIFPTHSLETYWTGVVNDMPSVAGLHYVLQELLALPASLTTENERASWRAMQVTLPPLPKKQDADGSIVVDNAAKYDPRRTNYEAPDLYCLFPFRLYGWQQPGVSEVLKAYRRMPNPGRVCWYQTGIFAARLGLASDAAKDITARSAARLKGFRFPGYMDSPHDWKPDYDGPANMMNTMQEMLLQCQGDSIYLFPAWPRQWNVDFKLHAFGNTVISGKYENGQLLRLQVYPENRRKFIRVMTAQ